LNTQKRKRVFIFRTLSSNRKTSTRNFVGLSVLVCKSVLSFQANLCQGYTEKRYNITIYSENFVFPCHRLIKIYVFSWKLNENFLKNKNAATRLYLCVFFFCKLIFVNTMIFFHTIHFTLTLIFIRFDMKFWHFIKNLRKWMFTYMSVFEKQRGNNKIHQKNVKRGRWLTFSERKIQNSFPKDLKILQSIPIFC
jgi:hypothetical protein